MDRLNYLREHAPNTPVEIHIGAMGRIRDIDTIARYAPAMVADHSQRNDVHTVRVVTAGKTLMFDGPLADRYRRAS